jgi:hypothetical protein
MPTTPAPQKKTGTLQLMADTNKALLIRKTGKATNSAVDVTLRLDATVPGVPAAGRIEAVRTRADDPFTRRVRLTSEDQVDDGLLAILATALARNS